jgi:hypothetical protein
MSPQTIESTAPNTTVSSDVCPDCGQNRDGSTVAWSCGTCVVAACERAGRPEWIAAAKAVHQPQPKPAPKPRPAPEANYAANPGGDPYERLVNALAARDRPVGKDGMCRCPGHADRRPSLHISRGQDGRAVAYCHAGCPPERWLGALGMTLADLQPAGERTSRVKVQGLRQTWRARGFVVPGLPLTYVLGKTRGRATATRSTRSYGSTRRASGSRSTSRSISTRCPAERRSYVASLRRSGSTSDCGARPSSSGRCRSRSGSWPGG